MDGKENEIANGAGTAAENQAQEGQSGAQAAGETGASPVAASASPSTGAMSQKPAAPKPAIDYAAELAKRDANITERDGKIAELQRTQVAPEGDAYTFSQTANRSERCAP